MSAQEFWELGLGDGLDHGGCRGGHADVLDSGVISAVGVCARAPHPNFEWHDVPALARLPDAPLLASLGALARLGGERLP